MKNIRITSNEAGQRLDRFLRKYMKGLALSEIYKMIRKKQVKVNDRKVPQNYRLVEGDVLQINMEDIPDEMEVIRKSSQDFSIIYEDSNIIIVDKPPELILHPDAKHKDDTLVDQVKYYLYRTGQYNPQNETTFKPAAANRLDVNTGGIVIFAKNYSSLQDLNQIIREKLLEKRYICIVKGKIEGQGLIESYLIKDEKTNTVRITPQREEDAKKIATEYISLKASDEYSLLEVNLITGRSHQIRAQLAYLNHPIIGDPKYGEEKVNRYFRDSFNLQSQFLYAYKIVFKGTTAGLNYLKGKVFTSTPPVLYRSIIEELFGCSLEECCKERQSEL